MGLCCYSVANNTGGIPYPIKQLKEIVFTNFWKLPNWMKKGHNTGRNGQNMLGQMEISKFAFRILRHLPPVTTKNINHWHGSFMISIWCEMPFSSILLLNYHFLYLTNILLNLYLCVWYEKLLVCSAAAAADVTMETQFTGTNQNISGSSSSLNQLCRLGGWPASAEPGLVCWCCAILMTNPGLVICSISIQHTSTPS